MKLPFDLSRLSDDFLQEMVKLIRVNGKPLSKDQRAAFLLGWELPEGIIEYPEAMDPKNWGHGSWTQALMYTNPVNGPYAILQPGGIAARTFGRKSGG